MNRGRAVAVAVIAMAVVPAAYGGAGGRSVVGCPQQSEAGFPGAFRNRGNLVVGPFAWLGAKRGNVDGSYKNVYRWKQPVLVRPGHTVTLRIGTAARGFAGLTYDHRGGWDYDLTARTVVFHACSADNATSRVDGRPVTFWSGGIVLTRSPACVPVEIRIDGRPLRRRVIALGPGARCP